MAVISGTDKGETLTGTGSADVITGLGGDDTLIGGPGADTLDGGDGNDTVSYETATEGVEASLTFDPFTTGDARGDSYVSVENLTGSAFEDSLNGDADANILRGLAGNDTLIGSGNDVLYGGAGNDLYYATGVDVVTEQTAAGHDDGGIDTVISFSLTYVLPDFVENLSLKADGPFLSGTGNAEDNIIGGNAVAVLVLDGMGGDDALNGGVGDDVLTGGAGADALYGDDGNDTASYATATAGVTASLQTPAVNTGDAAGDTYDSIENLIGSAFDDTLTGNGKANILFGGTGADRMAGGAGDDTYVVDDAGDRVSEATASGTDAGGTDSVAASVTFHLGAYVENLVLTGTADINATGNELNNTLTGNAGANVLNGGLGADIMAGGAGNDVYYVDNAGDVVTEAAGEGADKVFASLDYVLSANFENLVLTDAAVTGTGNDGDNIISGTDGNNTLNGLGGNDTLIGGLGADRMAGGTGDDTFFVDNAGDVVVENAGEGTDKVSSSLSYTLGANVENLTLTDSAVVGTGNGLDNTIIGDAVANTLTGLGGNDLLNGGGGADRMYGGAGDDTYLVDDAGDRVSEQTVAGIDDGGKDTVQSYVGFHLGAGLENLTLLGGAAINATGNELDNVLVGNINDNTLNGGAGADPMSGGKGNDTYFVDNAGDIVVENAGEGAKDKVIASLSYALADNVENLTVTGTGDFTVSGNVLNNILVANAGNNLIDGGAGADHMFGGAGNDTYIVDNDGDRVSEQVTGSADDGGTDTVMASVTYHIFSFVENLTLTGTADINGTGNQFNNVMTGNSGANVLNGGIGADTMSGGLGNDGYIVDNAGDIVIENADEGTDKVLSSISYALTANVENLTLTGSANLTATGNSLDNVISGNAGNNKIDGGTGADRMYGGAGNDTYVVDNAGDKVSETLTAGHDDGGTDLVQASVSFMLGNFVENLTLTGAGNIPATGNSLANILTGNAGGNTLNGMAGNDTLTGGAGADIFLFGKGSGADTITDFKTSQNDTIDATAYHGMAHTITQSGADAVIDFGGGNTITVKNVTATNSAFLSHVLF